MSCAQTAIMSSHSGDTSEDVLYEDVMEQNQDSDESGNTSAKNQDGEKDEVVNGSHDDEWEDVTMVVTVNGILDADIVRDAVERDLITLRLSDTDTPILQINNSLYTASWNQDLGTNMVLQVNGKEMEVVSCTSKMMTAEKALLTSLSTEGSTIAANAEVAPRAALSRTQPRGK
ncbi:unnamed protein product [Caenorhabditis nigoni]|uniref:Transcription factor TFIIIC triple barrel domain-containing protein n=1 Tax=Caenorhabditis nigoni TaxID=1611254 RepID=A0A2G5VIA1_9PELO|nr:hypothetical protein B9Z55_001988 [Caenorhabditis nigoni]